MVSAVGKLARVAVTIIVAGAIVGVAAGVPILVSPDREPVRSPTTPPAFSPGELAPNPIPASGTVSADVDGTGTTVVIDRAHANRVTRAEFESLTGALVRAGAAVEILAPRDSLDNRLNTADALVVMDPAEPYTKEEAAAVESFLSRGGRLLIAAEPNRRSLVGGSGLHIQESQVSTLGAQVGVQFGTGYIYNLDDTATDGNFKNVLASPPDGATAAPIDGVKEAAVFTATDVQTRDGRPLLVTATDTASSSGEDERSRTVATLAHGGDVLAIGDTTIFDGEHDAVADNEAVVSGIVDFLLGE